MLSRPYALTEEHANAASHAVGLLLAPLAGFVLLFTAGQRGGPWEIAGCAIYTLTLLAAYAASTLSHCFTCPRKRHACRTADQALIFLFIAGCWTPLAFTWLRSPPAWWILHGTMYAIALFGFISKTFFSHRVHVGTVSTVLYVILGWMPVTAIIPLYHALPAGMLWSLFTGGICYTAGLFFFHYDHRYPYFHTLWHLFVLAGTACHYLGILFYCTGQPSFMT